MRHWIPSLLILLTLIPSNIPAEEAPEPRSIELPEALPEPGPVPPIHPPTAEVSEVGSGLPLWHLRSGRVPLVSLNLLLRCGSSSDPVGKEGLASLTAAMLDEGAGDRNAVDLAKALDRLGANLSVSCDVESCTVSLSVLERNLSPALDIFADVLLRPTFPEDDWDRVKTLRLNNLLQARDRPEHVAREVGSRILFGADHPYGRSSVGRAETVEKIELEEARQFYRESWNANGAVFASCGNLSSDKLLSLLVPRFGAWASKRTGTAGYSPPSFPDRARPRVAIVNKPGAPQTVIRISGPGIARRDTDYVPLSLANIAFGGSFTSRLIQNLRERHGYTYNARSSFSRRQGPGLFVSSASVRTNVTAASIAEFEREYLAIRESGITADELRKSRATLRNAVIRGLGTIDSTAGMFLGMARNGLPPDELSNFVEQAATTTPEAVMAAIQRIIRWDNTTIVLVGDLESIREQMSESPVKLDGKIVVVDELGEVISELDGFAKK